MSSDSSDPRVGIIAMVGVASVVTLLVVRAGLTSYFDRMTQAEFYTKAGSLKPEALTNMRADETQRLTSGSMPIDKAMQQMSAKGRMGAGPALVPSASKDIAPLQGWMQMPATVPAAMMAPEPSAAPASSVAPAPSGAPSAAPSAAPAPSASAAPKKP